MAIKRFKDLPSTDTPINATNLNGNFDELGAKVGTSIDSNYKTNILYSKNLFDESTYTNGMAWNNATGFPSRATAYFSITAGKTYAISVSNISKLTGSPQIYIAEKTSIENANHTGNTLNITSNGNYTFTTTSSGKVLAVQLQMASGNISSTDYPNIMIVEGNTAQPYQPYITPTINVDGEDIYVKGQNEVYSTQEQRIGTWIDGKPLYRKVIDISNITSSNANLVDISGLNISTMVKLYGQLKAGRYQMPMPLYDSDTNYSVLIYNGTYIRGRCLIGTGSTLSYAYATIEYTKTTD